MDADRLENLLAGEDGMGALAVDVEGRDVEARLMACMLGGTGANAAGRLSCMFRNGTCTVSVMVW